MKPHKNKIPFPFWGNGITTQTGFLSNLVQRESLGWLICMPIYFLFDGDMAAMATMRHGGHICFFAPHDNNVLAAISKMVQDRGLVTIIHI